nr:DUF6777 domain-containing protein [Streptomyces sp. PR69]
MAGIAAAVVVAAVLAVALTRGGGDGGQDEVFLQAAGSAGPDPFTESSADEDAPSPSPPPPPASPEEDDGRVTRTVDGSEPGVYGGTRNVSSCDVEQQIRFLTDQPDKNRAFASVLDIQPDAVPDYLRSLTPVQLRADTRVTNHGYRDGRATSYQSVLQTGTAVLVDDRGVPRVRCACGNPLTPPQALKSSAQRRGEAWPAYSPSKTVAVTPSTTVVNVFILIDFENDEWFAREKGDTGDKDKPTTPPSPSPSPDASPTGSPSACPSPYESVTPSPGEVCPSPTESPASPSPTESPTESPGTESPGTESPGGPTEDGGPVDGTDTYGPAGTSPGGTVDTASASYVLSASPSA